MKWFRLYDELVDDPKVQLLPLEQFRALINLWCVASQNEGRFPPIEAIAHKLHMKPAKTLQILAALKAAGFIDEDDKGPFPHNWNGRQFKSDGASGERVKRYRERKRDGPSNGDETLHETFQKRPQSQKQNQSQTRESNQHPPENEAARGSLISPEAHTIAETIGQAAGFSRETWPPGWCGAAYTVQKFINDGYPGDLVRDTAIAVLKRKRDGPPENFAYFDRPIASAFAATKRPLPTVIAPAGQTIEAPHAPRRRTIIDAQDDLIAKLNGIESGAEIGQAEAGSGTGALAIRLLPQGRGE